MRRFESYRGRSPYSVLTGFPPPHRAPASLVDECLDGRFSTILTSPSPEEQREVVRKLAAAGRTGGAIYDALVALTAKMAGAALVTADGRAAPVYELIGVEVHLLD
ncbi:MAG: hypothetical protein M3Z84_00850 [Actinomycetota bacterium]|nr:hypothetical protein [Actinomycetota bacterium]